jgi:hypothetical protein
MSLRRFCANSTNWEHYPDITAKSAEAYARGLKSLVDHVPSSASEYVDINAFQCVDADFENALLLKFREHGSDKSHPHNYHVLYAHILKVLGPHRSLRVCEIGLGTNNPHLISTMGAHGRPGASLRAFRDLLPNASMYGYDVDTNILFQEERIRTFHVDQLDTSTFKEAGHTTYDLVIDDGLHALGANMNTLIFALKHLNPNGWIVIEDIPEYAVDSWHVVQHILRGDRRYVTFIIRAAIAYLFVVQRVM